MKMIERDGTNITVRGPLALLVMPVFAAVGIAVVGLSLLVAVAACVIVAPMVWIAEFGRKLGRRA